MQTRREKVPVPTHEEFIELGRASELTAVLADSLPTRLTGEEAERLTKL